jgi:FG-GAP repeat
MISMRRITLLVLLLLLAAVASPAPRGLAQSQLAAQPDASVRADFNQDGTDDLAVGIPGEDVGRSLDAGAVNVLYGGAAGLTGSASQLFTQVGGAIEAGDSFGDAIATGDFNHDGYADLAVGAPFEDAGSMIDVGAVSVLYGSAGGLRTNGGRLFLQVGGTVDVEDHFGSALATGDFNQDGYADLAAGAPNEAVGTLGSAGAVSVLYGSAGGLTATGGRLFVQVSGYVAEGSIYGAAVTAGDFNHDGYADLGVGAPFRDEGDIPLAGSVSVLYGSASGLSTRGETMFIQVGGIPEAEDFFGWSVAAGDFNHDAFADLAVGAKWENVGNIGFAGSVSVLYGSTSGLTTTGGRLFTQVGGAVETGDAFGSSVASGDFNHDGIADLAAGAPGEAVGTRYGAGAVSVLYGSTSGLTTSGGQLFTQVGGAVEAEDLFGDALAAGDFDHDGIVDLAVGAPNEGVGRLDGAGAASVLYGSAGGLTTTGGQLFTQDSSGVSGAAEREDAFGAALAAGPSGQVTTSAGASAPGSTQRTTS